MKRDDAIDFGTLKVSVLFRKLFFPTLLGMLGMSAVTAVDGIFVGHCVGSDGIAAINIVIPVLMLMTGVGLMAGTGCSVVASIHLSRGRLKVARLNVTQAMLFVTLVVAVPMVAMLGFPEATARWLGSSERLLPMVKDYMIWYVPSWIFMMWTAVALFVIRLDGAPQMAMACSLVAALLNVVLDWLFMFPLGWGVMGAALATSISTTVGGVMAIVYLLFFSRKLCLLPLKMSRKSLRLSVRNIGYQCRIGSSALLGEATMAVLMFMGNQVFMHYLGDDGVGAFGIACYYARETEQEALRMAVVCGTIVTLVFLFAPQQLVGMFVPLQSPAAQIATFGFPLFAAGFIPFILNLTAVGYFQSVERIRPATTFALLRGFLLLIPSFLLMPYLFGEAGIWLAMPVAEGLTLLLIVGFYLSKR